ncbi:lyase family protein [Paractinoplanes hotanensis]|uniref:Lyase family protein n=1 Tax=Paractinoplanes hotanensis TaxID=2906497 RepID=A0ABT0Y4G4_9ACTN|nr:lyase family protein [Actinoplanes hotanensis]MCM4080932.1 lyase family protein [Actinoplanes hotanensis]
MVPADRYWGAQTQRSLQHFSIGHDRMSIEVYRAYEVVKKAATLVNEQAGRLPGWKAKVIVQAGSARTRRRRPPSYSQRKPRCSRLRPLCHSPCTRPSTPQRAQPS